MGVEVLWDFLVALIDIFFMSLPVLIWIAFIIGVIILGLKLKG